MLKHKDILQNLSKLEKVAIVASALSPEPFERAGVPSVQVKRLEELDESRISYFSAARSWDPQLIGRLTRKLIAGEGCKNNLFVTPDLKTAVDPTREGLSEDACLNGEMGAEMIRAAHDAGAAIGVARPSVSEKDIAYVDVEEDFGSVHELFVKPFVKAVENAPCDAVFIDPSHEGQGYYDTNRSLLSEVQNGLLGEDVFIVGEGETFTADAVSMLCGKMTLGGCTIPLERAVRRYSQLLAYEEEGSVHHREIEESLRNGAAVDDDTLDAFVDDIIDFALTLDTLELKVDENGDFIPAEVEQVEETSEETEQTENTPAGSEENAANITESDGSEAQASDGTENDESEAQASDLSESGDEGEAQTAAPSENASGQPDEQSYDGSAEEREEEVSERPEEAVGTSEDGSEQNTVASEEAEEQTSEQAADENEEQTSDEEAVSEEDENSEEGKETPVEPVEKTVAAESVVLLKNENNLLPLECGAKVALIGEAYEDISPFKEKFHVVGKAKGYDPSARRSDPLIPAAVRATKNADAAIIFLRTGDDGKLALPANRLALIEALKRAKKRIIAVVLGDLPVDMSFDDGVDALLLAPNDCPYASEALAEILCGMRDPSGRLTRTYYDDADEYFRKFRADRDAKVMRVGEFVGYRRIGMDKAKVRYAFGHGLSYAKFSYSALVISDEGVSFTLTNTSDRDGFEVAQVYVGVPATHVAPKRQLRAFCKVFLKGGEARRVQIPLTAEDFETYDENMYSDNVEAGEYTIFVCSSSLDVRLKGKKTLPGVKREKDYDVLADFAPEGDYGDVSRLNKSDRVAKKGGELPRNLRALHTIAIYAVPILGVLFFIMVSVFVVSYALDYILLTALEKYAVEQITFLAAIAMLVLLPLFGSLNRKRLVRMRNVALVVTPFLVLALILYSVMYAGSFDGSAERIALEALTCITVGAPMIAVIATSVEKQLWRDKMGKNSWDKYYFERETGEKVTSDEEFDLAMRAAEAAREAKASKQTEETSTPAVIAEVPQFYDKKLTYSQMLADCKQFVLESGVTASDADIIDYIAAMSSTQLVFVPKGSGAELCRAVAEYFGRKAYIDNAENYVRFEDMFVNWHSGGYVSTPTELSSAFDKATKETAYLHTVLIRHIDKNAVATLFSPFADVLARRKMNFAVGERSVSIPANVFVVAEIENDEISLPENVAETCAVLSPECGECAPAPRRTIVQTVGFERVTAMRRTVRDDYPLDEDVWKSVDKLDERFKSGHIGNNVWNRMEMHSSIVLACGGDGDEAIDRAIAAELLHWLRVVWDESACEAPLASAISEVFGADKAPRTLALLENKQENEEEVEE